MASNATTLDRRRKLRAEFLEILIARGDSSIQAAMLAAEAIVKYVETGEVLGFESGDSCNPEANGPSGRRQSGGATRTR